ncbi:hypothetical protein O6H91_16G057300 [Diphasiastrum complanatum]|uniref:Uncharacterized protein n=2 Tax=Diphasiastrum complanatum TaxID=34168 RepID=A0ACC2BCH6_DIPCM|nr:hypothetical protein O6H91_16G057300 [Diphasiastrum complanatum]KAJ7527488.1 hypothetical protein O6H91_16G057300 [Diphasiastrum complanatum]
MSTPAASPNPAPPQPSSPPPSAPPPAPPLAVPPPSPPAISAPPPSPPAISAPPPPILHTPPAAPPRPQLAPPNTGNPPAQPTPPIPSVAGSPPSPHVEQAPPIAKSPPTPPSSLPPPKAPASGIGLQGNGGVSNTVIVGGVIGGAIALALILILIVCLTRRKSKGKRQWKDYNSSVFKQGGLYEPGRNPRFDPPYSSSDVSAKPYYPPPPPPLPPHLLRQSPNAHPEARLLGSVYDSGTTDVPSLQNCLSPPPLSGGSPNLGISKSSFTYAELEEATHGFSRANLLGEGGFGLVFKGILPDGRLVAVKQLKVGGGQGEREFQAEVEIISRVHHRHLVSLVGYCIADSQRMLVYEFVPNGTLEYHLHGKGRPVMDWTTRVKIAVGAARGLAYLHEDCHPRIIHRDIKSSNILIDYQFEAQVSDFGLAKLASDTHTHVTTRVMGTFGYLAPEYASTGKLTDKSDVFSFGVVLLELVTGRKPVDSFGPLGDESLVEWARPLLTQALEDGIVEGLIDPRLNKNYSDKEGRRMIEAAAACVRHSAHKRPKMGQVARALEGDAADLNHGTRPGHSSKYDFPYGSVDYDSAQYNSDLKRFRKMALAGSQEDGSEYSCAPSEYQVNPSISSGEYQTSKEIERKPIFIDRKGESGSGEKKAFFVE